MKKKKKCTIGNVKVLGIFRKCKITMTICHLYHEPVCSNVIFNSFFNINKLSFAKKSN